jgi:hypothetical protein
MHDAGSLGLTTCKRNCFSDKVGCNNRFFCPRRLFNHFTIALSRSARAFNCECDLARQQHRIERGSPYQHPPDLCPRKLHKRNEQQQSTAGKFWSDVKLPSASSLIGLISGQPAALLR